ncbi:hypothetical protein BDV96DRAFT_341964 [Lophiotrema nucula]|uniref:Uncharacterized protein n=1 Tax=Lophiotrema nucula TaxID=690887 RepID=A0A6A5ZLB6_9PLEO|nr:hypothetical protein BDV96DRAFT_341964 [Lophiotrema nucula]
MSRLYAVVLLVSVFVGGGIALPSHPLSPVPRSDLETVVGTYNAGSSLLDKRQATTIDYGCTYAPGEQDATRRAAAEKIAKYLEDISIKGTRCGLDKKQIYYNLLSVDGYEANLYFTGRISQTTAASYSCKDIATEIRNLQQRCKDTSGGADSILEWTWLLNCISTPTFSSSPPQPYTEGGVGLEFRKSDFASPNHPQKKLL